MSAAEVIATCVARGIELATRDGRLHYRAPAGAMSPALREVIAEHKGELRHLLALTPADPEYGTALAGVAAALGWGRVERRPRRCYSCRGTRWWQRPSGGWVCGGCHPQPRPSEVGR